MRFDAACFNRINDAYGRHFVETFMSKHYSTLAALALIAMLAVPAGAPRCDNCADGFPLRLDSRFFAFEGEMRNSE
jgi:hypothetical protein